jgi:uncharacterized protein YjiS (DUF1127 family)
VAAAVRSSMINYQPDRLTIAAHVTPLVRSVMRTIQLWRARIRERRAFPADLDERQLHDLRLSRWELDRELRKPFWRG